MRARIEAKARESVEEVTRARVEAELESDMTRRAELEGQAQAKAFMAAKAKAELEEEAQMRAEQERKAREIAEILRTKTESAPEAADDQPVKRTYYKRRSIAAPLLAGLFLLLVAGVVVLHFVPLSAFDKKVEQHLSAWLQDDVSITTLHFSAIPRPHLRMENVAVGKQLDAVAIGGRVYPDLASLFGDRLVIHAVELDNITISREAAQRILQWGKAEGKSGSITSVKLKNVRVDVKPAIEVFDASLSFDPKGTLTQAQLAGGGRWTLAARPAEKGYNIDFGARNWTLPVGPRIEITEVALKGVLVGNELVVPEFEASVLEGKLSGKLRGVWGPAVRLEADLTLEKLRADQFVATFTRNIAVTGKLDGAFRLTAEAPTVEALFSSPRAQGRFKVSEGTISNVDLVAVMQSDTAGQRAGVTKFNELSGEYGAADHRGAFRQVNLNSGVLRGSGAVEVGANSSVSGRVALEIRSQVAQDRGAFSVSGSVSRPILRRGG